MILAKAEFEKLDDGAFPSEYTALPEVYCLRAKGPTAGWHEPVTCLTGRGWKAPNHWVAGEENGVRVLSQSMDYTETPFSILIKDEDFWKNVRVSAKIGLKSDSPEFVGVIFRYQDSLNYYCAVVRGDKIQVIRFDIVRQTLLAEAPMPIQEKDLELSVDCAKDLYEVRINGISVLKCRDSFFMSGKAGIIAASPAVFRDFTVEGDEKEFKSISKSVAKRLAVLSKKRRKRPKMELWKEIRLGNFTGSRSVRYGDLTGNGVHDLLFAQADSSCKIQCLTAMDVEGHMLWQKGLPMSSPHVSTMDVAMQIADFDNCGMNEVVCAFGGEFLVLDGKTGSVKKRGELPDWPEANDLPIKIGGSWFSDCTKCPGGKITPNYIRVCNLSGNKNGMDFVCGYGYPYLWAFDNDLKQKWFYTGNVGHFCYTYDMDGDGLDEIMAGYSCLRGDGKWQFSLHLQDHADAVLAMPFNHPKGKLLFAEAAGQDGFLLFDLDGWFRQIIKGHVQHFSVAKFDRNTPGLQFAVVTYHGNPGIITIYDKDGVELSTFAPPCLGTALHPVNWNADGEELILFSGHRELGGLMDMHGDIVVEFPEKERPELCCEAIRFSDDPRDKIVVYDRDSMKIYRCAGKLPKDKVYKPIRPSYSNWSNFMAHYSYPHWT